LAQKKTFFSALGVHVHPVHPPLATPMSKAYIFVLSFLELYSCQTPSGAPTKLYQRFGLRLN